MKRYLVFGGDTYYPSGGWNDYIGEFDKSDEACGFCYGFIRNTSGRWVHMVDTKHMEMILVDKEKE